MSADIQSAIEKARQIAAKLARAPNAPQESLKRPADPYDDGSHNKKFASISDAVGAQLAQLKAQTSSTFADEIKVPDSLVGLGRGGEQVLRMQQETGCKIQLIDSEYPPKPDDLRTVTISGSKENVDRCKRLIDDILRKGIARDQAAAHRTPRPVNHVETFEMRIPINRCGVIIGRGGETIKRLSEQYGVKMVVQPAEDPNAIDRPLRMTGDADKIARAKEGILDLISPKARTTVGEYGTTTTTTATASTKPAEPMSIIRVPGEKAGVVIGKGGDSIKEIKTRSGAHVEIDKSHTPSPAGEKMFIVRGNFDAVMYAQQLIYEKITGVLGSQPPQGYYGEKALEPSHASQYKSSTSGSTNSNSYNGYTNPYTSGWTDPAKAAADAVANDPVAQAWAQYFQYYNNPAAAMASQAAAIAATTAATASVTPASTVNTSTATVQPTINPNTGQPDYTQAWVEYYRSMGMYAEAEAIIKQTQGGNASSSNGAHSPASSTPTQ